MIAQSVVAILALAGVVLACYSAMWTAAAVLGVAALLAIAVLVQRWLA